MTRFVGVDLASQPKHTSLCVIEWVEHPRVVDLHTGADDAAILDVAGELGARVGGVGIDCPFGWPDPFVDLVRRHHDGEPIADHPATPRELRLRTTDIRTREVTGRDPLSVSTDRLGIVALRGIRLLERLVGAGADRGGAAGVYEAYPAGSLAVWDLPSSGYKRRSDGNDRAGRLRRDIVAALATHVDLGGTEPRLETNDDDLDAVITAVVAGLAAAGQTTRPPPEFAEIAAVEGWIHVPAGPLTAVDDVRFAATEDSRSSHPRPR